MALEQAWYQVFCYVPSAQLEQVKTAVFLAGAGSLGPYDSCSWQIEGLGQFRPLLGAQPFSGVQGELSVEMEFRLEFVCPASRLEQVLEALIKAHPYEVPAYGASPIFTLPLESKRSESPQPLLGTRLEPGLEDPALAELEPMRQELQVYARSEFYHEMHQDFEQDSRFYATLLENIRGPILEIGCGSARVGRHLARMGHQVWALDLVPAMVDLAGRLAQEDGLNLQLSCQDMRDFHLENTLTQEPLLFDAILCPMNTLSHLLSEKDFLACMAAVKRHLSPEGLFIPSMFVPDPSHLYRDPEALRFVDQFYSSSIKQSVEVYEQNVYHPNSQINQITWFFCPEGDDESLEERFRLRVYYPRELRNLFLQAGFVCVEEWEDYKLRHEPGNGEEYSSDTRMQTIVMKQLEIP